METNGLQKFTILLSESSQYRIIEKYQRPEFYNTGNPSSKLIGVFLDIEATSLSYTKDKLIELRMVKFEYTDYYLNLIFLNYFCSVSIEASQYFWS